jgi:uncharacterized protein (TIGR00296 family)
METTFTQEEGEFLVRLARKSVKEYLNDRKLVKAPDDTPAKLKQNFGAFVTLNTFKNKKSELRGCIGYPYPMKALVNTVIECAISSAFQDPRFHPVAPGELDNIAFEVSVLTQPQKVQVQNLTKLPEKIKVGEDGLMVENGINRGLLLPQVPLKYKWDEKDFLNQTCMKAGLTPDCWLMKSTKIYKFQCIIISEESPKGLIKLEGPNLR